MTHMKRKLTLLLMCLLLLGGAAMASSEEIETDASEEISEEAETETEVPPEETPTAEADPSAQDYINYYLMSGDSPYLEVAEAIEYIYTSADESNYEQIVFSAVDWNGLSETAQNEINTALPEGYLALLQEAVDYAAAYSNGTVGSAAYVVTFEDGEESGGAASGISVAELIEEAGLSESIYIPDTPALLADFGTDSAVRYNYGWWGGGRIYYGTKPARSARCISEAPSGMPPRPMSPPTCTRTTSTRPPWARTTTATACPREARIRRINGSRAAVNRSGTRSAHSFPQKS